VHASGSARVRPPDGTGRGRTGPGGAQGALSPGRESTLRIPRRKALALFAYLASTARTHSRDTLAAFLWPEHDQSGARGELRRTLSSLNGIIGHEWLIIDRDTAALDENTGCWVDIQAFEKAIAACAGHDPPPGALPRMRAPPCGTRRPVRG
jgi:hypothetical protein